MASGTARTVILSASRLQSASMRPLRHLRPSFLVCGRVACCAAAVTASHARHRTPMLQRLYSTESSSPAASPSPRTPSPANDVVERYRSRLESKAQKEGVADIDQLRAAYMDKIEALRRRDAVVPEGANVAADTPTLATSEPASAESSRPSTPASESASSEASTASSASTTAASPTASAASAASTPRGVRPLASLLDLDKVRTLPVEELSAVWRLRFANDPLSLCAVIPAQTYAAMEAAARARPQFVLPVPHPEQGAEIHFLQWTFDTRGEPATAPSSTVLFTQLAEYKVRGEFAAPHTTVTHYTDLAADCGVVLMQGQVADGRGVTADHAQWLVMCLQRFYGAWAIPGTPGSQDQNSALDEGARARRLLLQWFAAGDPQFSIERLMEEVEKLA
ncbi:ATP synthase mitochondrial F1 complex assembly factor 1 [Sporothrix schenckii 1099-18]|uniref:ATP synthase mitochondrial F1 complex assembly factor 1 n=2 Tax=Sporothrix schenckii TaxID=29908 RepID=U7Q4H4_SPOS1|nr:ATP synthase mitochondrial F1 complex assembly factor 1 [Sporothrix schenckii 1099-18]ERT01890.1 hypothetical protein HMPREF1624_00184 [Sporothrix schenckii ATCC 58251]KJR80965.1 ATP synthase mitochondrial F1 complex assembly factor 1 [Sporothrix schenckii 1099-18]